MRAALFSYVWRHGEQFYGVDGRPGESRPVVALWRVLCPNRSGFEGSGVEVGCPAAVRGPIRGCRQQGGRMRHSGGRGDVLSPCTPTASGMSSQCPA
jgi:hypothetical protein